MSTADDVRGAFEVAARAANIAASALPEPSATIARVVAAALETGAKLLEEGKTPEQIVAAIRRAHRIDTSVEDAAVDALVAAKPSAS